MFHAFSCYFISLSQHPLGHSHLHYHTSCIARPFSFSHIHLYCLHFLSYPLTLPEPSHTSTYTCTYTAQAVSHIHLHCLNQGQKTYRFLTLSSYRFFTPFTTEKIFSVPSVVSRIGNHNSTYFYMDFLTKFQGLHSAS